MIAVLIVGFNSNRTVSVPVRNVLMDPIRLVIHQLNPQEKTKACPMTKTFESGSSRNGECEYMFLGWHGTASRFINDIERKIEVFDDEQAGYKRRHGDGFYVTDTIDEAWGFADGMFDPAMCAVYVNPSVFRNRQKIFIPPTVTHVIPEVEFKRKYDLWFNMKHQKEYIMMLRYKGLIADTKESKLEDTNDEKGNAKPIMMSYFGVDDSPTRNSKSMQMSLPSDLTPHLRVDCIPKVVSSEWVDMKQKWPELFSLDEKNGGWKVDNVEEPVVKIELHL
ncbi:hypothetical protein BKA69DRAFT_1122682 [Paraphysoderma sedebokerense]|nr:hypothetical protein BKA69DRAFT_1122682 [Paraphysoderma sedebokerense]